MDNIPDILILVISTSLRTANRTTVRFCLMHFPTFFFELEAHVTDG